MTRRTNTYGVTLVELLVVMAIIGLMTAVSIPVLSRMGLFGTKKADLAARELFAVMRGVQVHASTNNVDTAIVYSVRTPIDSLEPGEYLITIEDENGIPVSSVDYRPIDNTGVILDGYMTVRKITPAELLLVDGQGTPGIGDDQTLLDLLKLLGTTLPDGTDPDINPYNLRNAFSPEDVYVPIETRGGVFKPFPKNTAVLTNHPAALLDPVTLLSDANSFQRETGLVPVFVVDLEINGDTDEERTIDVSFIEPRILYQDRDQGGGGDPQNLPGDLDEIWDYQFPAHVFRPDGTMQPPPATVSPKERIKLRVGLRPDQEVEDRFLFNSDTERVFTNIELDPTPYEDEYGNPINMEDADELVGIETEIHLFQSSGRVKVAS